MSGEEGYSGMGHWINFVFRLLHPRGATVPSYCAAEPQKDVKQVCEPQLDENKSELLRKHNPRLENTVFDSKGDCITVS